MVIWELIFIGIFWVVINIGNYVFVIEVDDFGFFGIFVDIVYLLVKGLGVFSEFIVV